MRILIDECVPKSVGSLLTGQQMGWSGMKNGQLLSAAASQVDVFLTSDQNLPYQQNLDACAFAVIVLTSQDARRISAAQSLLLEHVDRAATEKFQIVTIP